MASEDKRSLPEGAEAWEAPAEERTPLNLRGDLVDKNQPSLLQGEILKGQHSDQAELSSLRGKLIETAMTPVEKDEYSPEWLQGKSFIQRDSGEEFRVQQFTETKSGLKVNLVRSKGGTKVTLDIADFVEKLKTPGSPWAIK